MSAKSAPPKLTSSYQPARSNVGVKLLAFGLFAFGLLGMAGILLLGPSFLNGNLTQADLAQVDQIRTTSPTAALTATAETRPTASPSPVPTDTASPVTPAPPLQPGCLGWEQVSQSQLGQEICVQGTYLREYQKEDGVYVMVFSEQPGSFQVWSAKRPFSYYLPAPGPACVIVRGWLMTSGVRPLIMLGKGGTMEACP